MPNCRDFSGEQRKCTGSLFSPHDMVPPSSLVISHGWGLIVISHCARPRRTVTRDRQDVRDERDGPHGEGLPILYTSLKEWPRLPFTARIERPQLYRGGSASKKGTWPLPVPTFRPAQLTV